MAQWHDGHGGMWDGPFGAASSDQWNRMQAAEERKRRAAQSKICAAASRAGSGTAGSTVKGGGDEASEFGGVGRAIGWIVLVLFVCGLFTGGK